MERLTFEGNFCDISMCREIPCPYDGACTQRRVWERLKEYEDAEQDGRLVMLDEPMRTLIWGDEEHDTILCPRCLCDLMGGFEFAPSCETAMYQCPHCGQPIDGTHALTSEEAEAAMKEEKVNDLP